MEAFTYALKWSEAILRWGHVLFAILWVGNSFIVYHKYNWLILCLIAIISALGRHYFNLRGRNVNKQSILFTSIIALILLASVIFIFKT